MRLRKIFTSFVGVLSLGLMLSGPMSSALSSSADAGPRKGGITAEKGSKKKKKSSRSKGSSTIRYQVKKGDNLGEIAAAHGVSVKEIVRWNKLSSADKISIGQKLKIRVADSKKSSSRSSKGGMTKRKVTYVVRKGDTLGEIAKKNSVSMDQLKKWNRAVRKNPDRLRIGQKITIEKLVPSSGSGRSESIGKANRGQLIGGQRLPKGDGYVRRNSKRAYGTELTVTHIQNASAAYKAKFKRSPDFVIGDLSHKKGGKMKPHKSHQSGRDVDIGYVAASGEQLTGFQKMTAETIDAAKNWYLIEQFLETGDVEYIFVNYELQKPLYEAAKKRGYSEKKLESIFQYPNGKRSYKAVIRHSRGHDGHMHVRFGCPKGDKTCK